MSGLNFSIQPYYQNGFISESDVRNLKHYLKGENLPHDSDELLGVLLVFCKGNLEKAKRLAKVQYKMKNNVPETFDNRILDNQTTRDMWKIVKLMLSPQLDDGSIVMIMGLREHSAYQIQQEIIYKLLCMALDSGYYDKPVTGYRVVIDLENFNLILLTRMNWNLVRRLLRFAGNSMSEYIKCVHFINGGYIMNQLYKLIKLVVSSQIIALFNCHDKGMDWNQFYENHISKEYLPSDYGGDLDSIQKHQDDLWRKLESMADYFAAEEKIRKMYPGLPDS